MKVHMGDCAEKNGCCCNGGAIQRMWEMSSFIEPFIGAPIIYELLGLVINN
ncbi:hypothetical protein STEG23_006863, partial [Scotinomys teguina]